MLYLPILLVGGIGLSEMRSVEEELRNFRSHAEPLLDGASKEFDYELDAALLKAFSDLKDGMDSREIIERIVKIPVQSQGSSAIRFAFLLPRNLKFGSGGNGARQPIYPRSGTPRYLFGRGNRLTGISRKIRDRVRGADQTGYFTGARNAIEHLERIPQTDLGKPQDEAFRDFNLGSWLGQAKEWNRASQVFKRGRQALEHSGQTESFLYLDLLLAELRSLGAQAEQASQSATFEALLRKTLIHRLIGGMARGEFDAETPSLLNDRLDRAMRLAKPLLEADSEFATEVEDYLVQRQLRENYRAETRAILRHLQLIAEGRLIDLKQLIKDQGEVLSVPYAQAGGTGILALKPIRSEEENGRRIPYYVGLLVDLASLLEPKIRELELRLDTLGNPYRVELMDEAGRAILDSIRTPMDASALGDAAGLSTTLHLQDRFKGFSLLALPVNPQAITDAERLRVWMRIAALLGLIIMAFGAAYLFVRTVKKEREFANLRTGFVARVSHELKTPLSLIRMYGETLAMGRVPDPEKASHFAGIIAQESDRLSRMIDNVLDFSQIGAGTKDYSKKDLRLDLHIKSLMESYAPHLEAQGFDLRVQAMPALKAEVDAEALTQTLVNLIGNARKYTPDDGEKIIEVHLSKVGHQAWIEILDRGVGVPEDERNRIFETFYRAKTSEERRGAGLGLALVQHFAQHHGGSVECLGRMGGGSVFRIRLPLSSSPGSGKGGNRTPNS